MFVVSKRNFFVRMMLIAWLGQFVGVVQTVTGDYVSAFVQILLVMMYCLYVSEVYKNE